MKRLLCAASLLLALARAPGATEPEAFAAKQAGDYPRAIALYRELVAADPDNAGLLFQLGTVQGWAGRYDEALATLERGLALAPRDLDLRLARGRVLAWSGQLGRAEAVFREIVRADPANLDARNMLGRVQAWTRQFAAAERTFDAILAQDPANTDALVGRGDVEKLQERPDAARPYYERAAATDPQASEIRRRLAGVRRAGRWRLDAGAGASTFPGDVREDWSGWDAALRYAIDKRTGASVAVEQAERFGLTDWLYSAGVDRRFSDDFSGTALASFTPDADFLARRTLALTGAWRARRGDDRLPPTLLLAEYKAATYDPGTAHSAWLGVTQYTTHRVAVTAKTLVSRNLNDRWTGGWQLRLDGEPADHWRWHLGYADSKESLSSTVFDLIRELRTRAVFAGWFYEFSPAFAIRLDAAHEWADGLPDRNAFHAGFTTRF
ncbi:MAG TPA: tetratricopeptide repeat protein [Opitutaceae bacterium]|nr:tetratricopeptide repeat protein [Opitutaceae bacterium]